MTIHERLRIARVAFTMTQEEVATQSCVSLRAYQTYESGRSLPGAEAIEGLIQIGINANWLLTGKGPMRLADLGQAGDVTAGRVHVAIPKHIVKGSDGLEKEILSELVDLAFDRQWLEARGIAANNLLYLRMPDDSMTPTIRRSGLVALDGVPKLRDTGLYGVMAEEMSIKRLEKDIFGNLWVRSDNPIFKDFCLKPDKIGDLMILGKVIWASGEL